MHIFFSGIGGGGIGPLALIARQAGHEVSGSDKQASDYTKDLQAKGISLYIGQSEQQIAAVHAKKPIDWYVYSSAVVRENAHPPELAFAKKHHIKTSRRDELLNEIIQQQKLKLIGVAGTHGKSTTTAMVIWLFHKLGIPIGHSVGTKLSFAPMGQLQAGSQYFVYECDEFDRNFLAFHPYTALITGISWDHHEIFPTFQDYQDAFRTFLRQSETAYIWQEDAAQLQLPSEPKFTVIDERDPHVDTINLPGAYNRQDALQAILAVHDLTQTPITALIEHIDAFPGLKQRMEQIAPNLYSNYAHTPEKIKGGMLTAQDLAKPGQRIIVIYEPLTNRRQHYIKDDYKDCFAGSHTLYWVPTYLAREDPNQAVLTPTQLLTRISEPKDTKPAELNDDLLQHIRDHLANGDLVVAMGASGAGSLDEWLRQHFSQKM